MDAYSSNALLSSIGIFILAVLPVIQDRRNKLYLSLFGLNLAVAMWLFELYLLRIAADVEFANIISRIFRPFMLSTPFLLYNFVLTFAKWSDLKNLRFVRNLLLATTVISIFMGLFGIGVKSMIYKQGSGYYADMDMTYYIFLFNVFAGVGISIYLMIKKYRDPGIMPIERKKIQYLNTGVFIAVAAGLVTFLKIMGLNVVLIGPYGMLAYFILTTYAILSFDLLNIREILQRTMMYAVTAALIAGNLLVLTEVIFPLVKSPVFRNLILFTLIFFVAVSVNPTLKFMDKVTKKVFFISNYDYQALLQYVINEFRTMKSISLLLAGAAENITGLLKLRSSVIFFREENTGKFRPYPQQGAEAELLDENHILPEYLRQKKDIVFLRNIADELAYRIGINAGQAGADTVLAKEFMQKYKAELCLPLTLNGSIAGFWIIGEKKNRESIRMEEVNWLKNVAAQVSVMVENILLYQQLMNSERLVMLGEMAAAVAHEIRNPLTGLSGFIQMINSGQGSREKIMDRFFKIAPQEFKRLEKLTENLLALSHTTRLNLKKISLNSLSGETLEFVSHLLKKKKIEVSENYEEIPDISADREQLRQVFLNLIINAAQSMPEGGCFSVKTGKRDIAGAAYVYISFIDTGCGMNQDTKNRIFEPFFTTKADGSGLGLAISRNIIQAHGGVIEAKTTPGKGSQFTVSLPENS